MKALAINRTLKESPETFHGHLGPGPGPDHREEARGRDWAHDTGRAMADTLHGVAVALAALPLKAPA
ncbi:hypothetical protein [Streptomyces sp. Y7]|uniref:hypothetical protein n=1 Tax=Streptomyces sp. Y7 TaxID=3342392 RepID=UPI003714AB80